MDLSLFKKLQDLNIHFTTYEHEPVFTVEQARVLTQDIPGASCKNLFLKDSKGNFYLIVAIFDTQIKLKNLSKYLKAPELRFASPELLKEYLGVEPGSVTPFGLLADHEHKIRVLLDERLFENEKLGFHPLRNSATTVISPENLKQFIEACGNMYFVIDFGILGV